MGTRIRALSQGLSRALGLAPTTVGSALAAIAVLLAHRLQAGRGRGSWLAARPLEERGRPQPARARKVAVRPAA